MLGEKNITKALKKSLITHCQVSAVVPVWYWVERETVSSLTPAEMDKKNKTPNYYQLLQA